MYHFAANSSPEPVRLSFRALIPGHIRQYLKDFQLDAIRFMHNFLAKGEFCVYNDESGLGKQAAVVVLLDAACHSRKCLIVVQNDDRYLSGWEFHFNVLTKTNVMVIKDGKDTTDSSHSIYLAKWSTLRTIDDLSSLKFDFIILDNRGQMLNNSFCTSMLLKHYERKINILISSVDITSDLKLLHNVLRLGGRLDPHYSSFKVFEEKFKLPDVKELAYKRVDLEEYFCKRERLADYCKAFRLRRYCHQYETQLPLVKEDRYMINLQLWREKQNSTNSESSSIEIVNPQNRENEHIKDTQELFEDYCRQRRKQHLQFQQEEEQRLQQREREMLKSKEVDKEIIYNVDDEVALINDTPPIITTEKPLVVASDNSDEAVLMSPLLVESDSDPDDMLEICNDIIADIEIVDLSSEEKQYKKHEDDNSKQTEDSNKSSKSSEKNSKKKSLKKCNELERLKEDIVDTLKVKGSSKRISSLSKEKDSPRTSNKRLNNRLKDKKILAASPNGKTPKPLKNTCKLNLSIKIENKSPKNDTKSKKEKNPNENGKNLLNVPEIVEQEPKSSKKINEKNSSKSPSANFTPNLNLTDKRNESLKNIISTSGTRNATTPLTSKKTRSVHKEKPAKANDDSKQSSRREILEETTQATKTNLKNTQAKINSERTVLKRETQRTPPGVHTKQTRSMQRLTRSASGSKYLTKNLALQIDKIIKFKEKPAFKGTTNKSKQLDDYNSKQTDKNKTRKTIENKTENAVKDTQTSILSHRSSQDYETLQCAQRLSGDVDVFINDLEKNDKFLVPPTPTTLARNSLIPSSLTGFFTESEIIFIHPPNPNNAATNSNRDSAVLSISSSDNENSTSQSSLTNISATSRRTRALKPKKNQLQKETSSEANRVSSFTDMLAQQEMRSGAKSPDLFSNCSDLIQLPCTQPNLNGDEPNAPFEGFKIFGSEVKQLQQHYAANKSNNNSKSNSNQKKSYQPQRSCLDILEKMFEPSNKKSKQPTNAISSTSTTKLNRAAAAAEINKQKTHTQILPSHPVEAISEARQQEEQQKRNGLIAASSSGLQDDEIFEITNNGTFGSVMRLHSNGDISPVQHTQKTNVKQHNKITNYLVGNATQCSSQDEPILNTGNCATVNTNAEAGTPSKRHQNINVKKSPKGKCNTTQTTKLTKWFTKPSEKSSNGSCSSSGGNARVKCLNLKRTPTKQVQANHQEVDVTITTLPSASPPPAGKRIIKRRRLDLSFSK